MAYANARELQDSVLSKGSLCFGSELLEQRGCLLVHSREDGRTFNEALRQLRRQTRQLQPLRSYYNNEALRQLTQPRQTLANSAVRLVTHFLVATPVPLTVSGMRTTEAVPHI